MPWQETWVRNERTHFIVDWERDEESMAELCRRYGVSRRTGYKWLALPAAPHPRPYPNHLALSCRAPVQG